MYSSHLLLGPLEVNVRKIITMYVHYYFLKQVRLWLSLSVGRPNDILLDSGIAALGPTGTGANTNDAPGTPGDLLLGCTYKVGTS